MKTLSFRELEVGYQKSKPLLKIDTTRDQLELKTGVNLLAAPNGFGKSACLLTLSGVLPPIRGELFIDGNRYHGREDSFYLSEYIAVPKFILASEWVEVFTKTKNASLDLWERFHLADKKDKYLGRMSQGERRKVSWICAAFSNAPVILLDEPFDGLDLLSQHTAFEVLKRLEGQGKIILIVTHHIQEILPIVSESFLIREGKLWKWPKVKSLSTQDLLEFYVKKPIRPV